MQYQGSLTHDLKVDIEEKLHSEYTSECVQGGSWRYIPYSCWLVRRITTLLEEIEKLKKALEAK